MPVCAVCSSPASSQCSRCKSVSYCSPAHQKEDWKAHKIDCPRLAQEALAAVFKPCDEELLLRITTCLAQNGYNKEVGIMVQLNKAFWTDEQIWDAYKDYVPGSHGRTRLLFASCHGLLVRVKWLLARGARLNSNIAHGWTALMGASRNGHLEVVRELYERGANVSTSIAEDGFTALMFASQYGHLEVVRELCKRGANVNAVKTEDSFTALMWASQEGHLDIVRALLEKGANVNHAARASEGCTPLILACQNGHLKIVSELCSRGANVIAKTVNGVTALHAASNRGHLEVVRLLLQKGANKSVTSTGEFAVTPFSAANGPHKAAIQALLKL